MKHRDAAAIVGFALLLVLPAMLAPPMTRDSFWIDWVWADQFTSELRRGNIYPRWLPLSHDGLGSPVFYFYPPLAFYVSALFGLAGFSTYASILCTFWTALVASGFAMFVWLKDDVKTPLIGALLFMAAPYHIYDFYGRGAQAEFLAIAFIPLVALGVRRAAEGRVGLAALAYAGIILSHLPLALLASAFLMVPYALYLSRGSAKILVRVASAVALGLLLASIYVVPALALDAYRDTSKLWLPQYWPSNWSLMTWDGLQIIVALIIAALAPAAVWLFVAGRRLISACSAAGLLLAAGAAPFVWDLPALNAVQFPFRVLSLAEFAIVTGLATAGWRWFIPAMGLSAVFIAAPTIQPVTISELAARHPDVVENLPPGFSEPHSPSQAALRIAKAHPGEVFYFPSWQVTCDGRIVETWPDPETRLLSHRGENCTKRIVATYPEKIGGLLSFLGLLLLLLSRAKYQRNGGSAVARQGTAATPLNRTKVSGDPVRFDAHSRHRVAGVGHSD